MSNLEKTTSPILSNVERTFYQLFVQMSDPRRMLSASSMHLYAWSGDVRLPHV